MAPNKHAEKLRRVAEKKGEADDQFRLGNLYYDGREGLAQDRVAAAAWWRKAAVQGLARARFRLGVCYLEVGAYTHSLFSST
jgi:TPR repeat protein